MSTIKGVIRAVKAEAKGYSELELKVRQATCNDKWGPSTSLMNDICDYSQSQNNGRIIIHILDKRLNDSGKNWRHVFKSLTVYQYLLENGPEYIFKHAKKHIYMFKTLKDFQYLDESGNDQGNNVRVKSKELTNLILNEAKLNELRANRANIRERVHGSSKANKQTEDDPDLQRAIQASLEQSEIDERRRRGYTENQEDVAMQRAIEASEKEALSKIKTQLNTGQVPTDLLLDFFESVEEPSPQNLAFDSNQFQGFQSQQQPPLQWQQEQQLLQEQQERQRMLQQQQAYLQQQQQFQQPFFYQQANQLYQQKGNEVDRNQHNPFNQPPIQPFQQQQQQQPFQQQQQPFQQQQQQSFQQQQQQQQQKQQQFQFTGDSLVSNYSSNSNAVLDPFSTTSQKTNIPLDQLSNNSKQILNNPFATGLVNLDSASLAQKEVQIPKNPFSNTSNNRYQWNTNNNNTNSEQNATLTQLSQNYSSNFNQQTQPRSQQLNDPFGFLAGQLSGQNNNFGQFQSHQQQQALSQQQQSLNQQPLSQPFMRQ